ncbi:type III-B CRISPR module-associated protein Cmr3 [Thermus filiformis]|uniref:CRISPR-associated protein Cmr3 n=1 Tax=Thermus filiformis TaxID=276 RepID=A0A0A2WNG8_THEFI|nr:type III-B CRISPR module-associated protein Cmr3 [Thermus filiformis]KGQ21373.2 CRISPR-associated protein Cmr3 [Thermus filiformis]
MLIEPRDPLIVRDGRPFTNSPGARARSLPFPLPQTLAGAYRTRRGLLQGLAFPQDADRVRAWGVRGPLLAEEGEGGWRLMAPRPLDALRVEKKLHSLRPLALPEGGGTNLPEGLEAVVGLPDPSLKAKPDPLPSFWTWASFEAWLLEKTLPNEEPLGHEGPVAEVRTHVHLEAERGTAREGFLFQTSGLEFARKEDGKGKVRRLALVLWPEDGEELEGVFPLGGERRLAYWRRGGPGVPEPPQGLLEGLVRHHSARLLLLTPALFRKGFLPEGGAFRGARVVAAAVGRPLPVSGWDLKEGRPKPSRRAVPAGSVYFLRFPEAWKEAEIARWLGEVWFQNLSDEEGDRKDGFGLAAVGLWDGQLRTWEAS